MTSILKNIKHGYPYKITWKPSQHENHHTFIAFFMHISFRDGDARLSFEIYKDFDNKVFWDKGDIISLYTNEIISMEEIDKLDLVEDSL